MTERPISSNSLLPSEERWAWQLCRVSPVVGLIVWALSVRYLLYVLYLTPGTMSWSQGFRWKPAILLGVVSALLPWVWYGSIRLQGVWESRVRVSRLPFAAILSLVWVGLICQAITHERGLWFLVEWAKVRTPNPSFARNTLFWEVQEFERRSTSQTPESVTGLVGSSQMYQGTDLDILARDCPGTAFEKNCLAGFGPIQYPWLEERLASRGFGRIVCWLSEFDFFRDDELPANRLRWSATFSGCNRLWVAADRPLLDARTRWAAIAQGSNWVAQTDDHWDWRATYADLTFAAFVPVWRERDHIRRAAFHYWWNSATPSKHQLEPVLDHSADWDLARENLQRNIGRKRLVELNFAAFRLFAQRMNASGIELIVCEGTTDPRVTSAYDSQYRIETRKRLAAMSKDVGFTYLDCDQLPQFTESDFADPYHLNGRGRTRFSEFLARSIRRHMNRSAAHDDRLGWNSHEK